VRKVKAKSLTIGERRRLSIAEEIVHGPGLLLIDEPTTFQDIRDEAIMMQTFREMVNQDRTVVAAVHTVRYIYQI
jgi:ABC-type multidrug transport system ATPase subunit